MTDSNKKIVNPLFNISVTGSTVEDFSQHAVLLPAKEKSPPPSVLNLTSDQILGPKIDEDSQFLAPTPENLVTFQNQIIESSQITPIVDNQFETLVSENSSNFSSVFSSFSNILNLKGINSNNTVPSASATNFSIPPPAGIESILETENTNVQPIPLFPASGFDNIPNNPPASQSGCVNSFRQNRLKRPVYAQVPGLSTSSQPLNPINSVTQQNYTIQPSTDLLIPQSNSNFFRPQPNNKSSPLLEEIKPTDLESINSTPLLSEIKPTNQTISSSSASYFQTVSPQQPANIFTPTNSYSINNLTTTQETIFGFNSSTNLKSPVMAAIPASEILDTNFNNVDNGVSNTFQRAGDTVPSHTNENNQTYRPVYYHWFHKREIEGRNIWEPFSMVDSLALEEAFTSTDLDPDRVVATDGGRFDVNILRRERMPVYWKGNSTEVRRCSWFHKGSADGRYLPYEENIATKLEEELKIAYESKQWHRKIELPNGETVVFHSPDVLVLYPPTQSPDAWGNTPNQLRPRIVKRGMDEFDIDEGEPAKVDHLLFLVHGIGSVCDLKFRNVEEVVDDFRSISLQLVQSHYRSSCEKGIANRIEVLPISWHEELHSEETGIDRKLKTITLESIPRLRDFTNDTLLDILFYTSPIYCQTIVSTVGNQMNKIFELFKQRNPDFKGGVSLGGHSLGSLIIFDLLCHQHPESDLTPPNEDNDDIFPPVTDSKPPPLKRRMSRRISYMMGTVGTGQPQIVYPHLNFQPSAFFALGSPIGMFVTIRGLDNLGTQFALPTCPAFFNIFHPYDPVAYRIESLINSELSNLKPVLIPHHKGRKRIHLELKETMARVGADFKQKVIDSMKSTWNSVYQLSIFQRPGQTSLEEEVDKAFNQQLQEKEIEETEQLQLEQTDLNLGLLNNNRRIDYVLQETPFEFFNEYIFALSSHVCYWESEDSMLLILKEIYDSMNISTDDKIPQQTMTIERPPSSPKSSLKNKENLSLDPTLPMQQNLNLGPPPVSGFVKKT